MLCVFVAIACHYSVTTLCFLVSQYPLLMMTADLRCRNVEFQKIDIDF